MDAHRYEEEEREREAMVERLQREENETRRQEKLREEEELRDKLLKNVHQLEQRRMEVQRELLLRALPTSGLQVKSAVVVPKDD